MWKRLKNLIYVHRFKINELGRDRAPSSRDKEAIYYVRRFITIRRGGEDGKQIYAGHLEVRITKPKLELGWQFKVGSKASETPFDGYIKFFGFSAYWGFENGRNLAHFITSRNGGYHNRELGFYTFGENGHRDLYWKLWVDDEAIRSKRSGSFSLSPAEWFRGPLKYRYVEVAKTETELELPDGTYPVTITLQKMIRYRTKRPQQILESSWMLDVDAPKGVPTHYDKSGGWKGDRTYGWGVPFKEVRLVTPEPIEPPKVEPGQYIGLKDPDLDFNQSKYLIETRMIGDPLKKVVDPDWIIDAKAAVLGWIFTRRAKTGFREPQKEE